MDLANLSAAFAQVTDPFVLGVILIAAMFGLFVGAIPGLSATMAVALLVPITFFMDPVPAVAMMVTATAMAITSGDIPGCLLRIPGTPSSAAYTDEAYAMTKKGLANQALGASIVFSCVGGLFGTLVLITSAPVLADFALNFSSYEFFWLVVLGLSCAIFISPSSTLRGFVSLLIGLLLACVGMNNPAAYPRFTFGNEDLLNGVTLLPMMVGMFAISEVLRYATDAAQKKVEITTQIGNLFTGMWTLARKYPKGIVRGSVLGTIVGALPGAGADIAAWMSYGVSKRFSREPEKFGTGHVEGIVEAGAANNSALAGAWIPALVFGIPGDSITAIVIGVLYMKNLAPGPMIFTNSPVEIYSVFIVFVLANIIMLPLGYLAVKAARKVLNVPRNILMPLILIFCIVGTFAINNSVFDVMVMLAVGVLAYLMEENDFPIAPAVLGVVLGGMLEEHFVFSMIKADGDFLMFFSRPIACALGIFALLVWLFPLIRGAYRMTRKIGRVET
ncbi:tripartite tricarboxylate transporter permease [Allopusillimonas ginsengisoli]|uniref:tripartite tricarboxylate transporter permease n=1 Tax=Allopusillimonas ginsengisoli TaxID=453575 RepID=UPI00101F2153|nr:tripartite tricarboxylate transporter permease [Allopusillimonas ginsengisoli]TEA70338.1 C4-dicarboxylate ABC transporter permease [Allopusillimonas ginsengisoli]